MSSSPPSVPAGWYGDPDGTGNQRYWNGTAWTDSIAPPTTAAPSAAAPAPSAPAPSQRSHTDAYVWTLALLPIIMLPIDYFAPQASVGGWWVAIIVATALCVFDARHLASRGVNAPSAWWCVLIPGYLIARTVRSGSTPAIPIVWFISFGVSVLGAFTFAAAYEIPRYQLENDIEEWAADNGARSARVICPATTAVRVGDTVDCTITEGGLSGIVRVTIEDGGGYSWRLVR